MTNTRAKLLMTNSYFCSKNAQTLEMFGMSSYKYCVWKPKANFILNGLK